MSDSAKQIEFYFDFGSPTAYLAHKQLAKMSDKYNADVVEDDADEDEKTMVM